MIIQIILFQLIMFIALIFMFRMLFYRNLDAAVKRLNFLYRENLARETEIKKTLKEAEEQKNTEIDKGKARAQEIIKESRRKAEILRTETMQAASLQAKQIADRGNEEIEKLKRNLFSEIENRALNLSLEMLKYTFSREGKEILQRQFFNEALKEIEKLEKNKFTVKTEEVKIKTAYDLTDKEKAILKEVLSEKLDGKVRLTAQVDTELIAGFVIYLDGFILDGSLQNRFRKAAPYLRKT